MLQKLNIGEIVLKYSLKRGREGPEGEWRCTSTCLISALDGSVWSIPRAGRFTPGRRPRYPLYNKLHLLPFSISSNGVLSVLCRVRHVCLTVMSCQTCLFGRYVVSDMFFGRYVMLDMIVCYVVSDMFVWPLCRVRHICLTVMSCQTCLFDRYVVSDIFV